MGRLGLMEIVVILLIALLLFGSKRLPEIGSALAQAIKEFRKASRDDDSSTKEN